MAFEFLSCEAGPSFCPLDAPLKVQLTFRLLGGEGKLSRPEASVHYFADSTRPGKAAARTFEIPGSCSMTDSSGAVVSELVPGDVYRLSFASQGALDFASHRLDATALNNISTLAIRLQGTKGPAGEKVEETLQCVVQVAPESGKKDASEGLFRVVLSPF